MESDLGYGKKKSQEQCEREFWSGGVGMLDLPFTDKERRRRRKALGNAGGTGGGRFDCVLNASSHLSKAS